MAKYFDSASLDQMNNVRRQIFALREQVYKQLKVDLLDTDALSALSIYEIVSQYDPDYNINFARNGEDAKSNDILIEQKATRVDGLLTRTGRPRKNSGVDAAFQFHAMGDLDYPRYIFVARNKDDLSVMRLYDISADANRKIVLGHLLSERQAWLGRSQNNQAMMKRDIILLPEKFIINNLNFTSVLNVNGCTVHKDS
jgi:hypothetical protein